MMDAIYLNSGLVDLQSALILNVLYKGLNGLEKQFRAGMLEENAHNCLPKNEQIPKNDACVYCQK